MAFQKPLAPQSPPHTRCLARNAPAHMRVIRTLRHSDLGLDEAYFLGGAAEAPLLEVFQPHILFDDQDAHLAPAAGATPSARVPTPAVTEDIPGQEESARS